MNKPWDYPDFFIGDEDFDEKIKSDVLPLLSANLTDGYFMAKDGVKLHYIFFKNPAEKGAVVISHGFCEFFHKYHETIYYFYRLGYSVYLIEHRCHGYSDRLTSDMDLVHVEDFDDYVEDLNYFISNLVLPDCSTKELYLFAHSMGGAIGSLYLEKYPQVFKKAVLSSPLIEMNYGSYPMAFINFMLFMSKIMGWQKKYTAGQHGFDNKNVFESSSALSKPRYEYVFKARQENEHYQTYGSSYGWVAAGKKATSKILNNTDKIKTPILLCQAGLDTMVSLEAQVKFVNKLSDIKFIKFDSSKHEIFNADVANREKFYKDIFEFLS